MFCKDIINCILNYSDYDTFLAIMQTNQTNFWLAATHCSFIGNFETTLQNIGDIPYLVYKLAENGQDYFGLVKFKIPDYDDGYISYEYGCIEVAVLTANASYAKSESFYKFVSVRPHLHYIFKYPKKFPRVMNYVNFNFVYEHIPQYWYKFIFIMATQPITEIRLVDFKYDICAINNKIPRCFAKYNLNNLIYNKKTKVCHAIIKAFYSELDLDRYHKFNI